MHKNKDIIGIFLVLLAVLVYLLLNGTERFYIFGIFKDKTITFTNIINNIHNLLVIKYPNLVTNSFLSGKLVDGLWFSSFCIFFMWFNF